MTGCALVSWLALAACGPIETRFAQVAPVPDGPCSPGVVVMRPPCHSRAVVLISGLSLHVIKSGAIHHAQFLSWQEPGSFLVSLLAADADVFSFAYAQSVPVTEIAEL